MLAIFAKSSIIDIRLGSKYVSGTRVLNSQTTKLKESQPRLWGLYFGEEDAKQGLGIVHIILEADNY